MRNKTRPLYGSFEFGVDMDITVLIARMQQVSAHFLENKIFNSYLKTVQGNSHYGLSYDELAELFNNHQGIIHTITASSSTLNGKGVNINIRFPKGESSGNGQFVIVAANQYENEEIRDMLLGKWVEKELPPEEEEIGVHILENQGPLLEDSFVEAPLGAMILEEEPPKPPREYEVQSKRFYFRNEMNPDSLVDGVYDLFIQFMDDATFDLRILSWQGDLYLGIKIEDLRESLHAQKGKIQKLYILLETKDGRKIDLVLSFAPLPTEADSELKVKSDAHTEIIQFVDKHFGLEVTKAKEKLVPYKLNFSFSLDSFQIERLIYLIEDIQRDHLPQAQATAFISNKGGVLYHDVALDQLKDLYYLYQKNIYVLSLYISRAITGQTLNLVFEFGSQTGSIALQTGMKELQDQMSSFIWETMDLKPVQKSPPKKAKPSASEPKKSQAFQPIFESKPSDHNPRLCMLIQPSNPAPALGMQTEIQRALEAAGLEVEESESIFGYLVMEKLWQKLNAANIVIADVSGKTAEVFYGLGIAHTLGREVILLTQSPADIPFDFKKYPHIIYEPNEAGYLNLRQELLAYLKKT